MSNLPIVVSIDCEPDPRVTPRDGPPPWEGMSGTIDLIERWRAGVPGARVGWYWRVDPQLERGHGDAGWALHTFRSHIDRTNALGDEHGVHPHPWRWRDEVEAWVSDAGDEDWVEHCVSTSMSAFARVLQRQVRVARMGDGYMSSRIMAALARAGVLCDLTLEPGARGMPSLVPAERSTGRLPDRSTTPRRPYRPARLDPCRPGRGWWPHRLWAFPLTTAPAGIAGLESGTVANLAFDPGKFQTIVVHGFAASLGEGAAYLSVVARSDVGGNAGLARYMAENLAWLADVAPGGMRPRFVRPLDALAMLGVQ